MISRNLHLTKSNIRSTIEIRKTRKGGRMTREQLIAEILLLLEKLSEEQLEMVYWIVRRMANRER